MSLVLAPAIADARAGSGSSQGSRGSHTNSAPPTTRTAPSTAQPMERSAAPIQSARPNAPMPAPMAPARSGLMSGLMGGLIGAGIAGMLFGGGFFGHGLGFGGLLGFLLQAAVVFFIGRWLFRRFFSSGQPALAGVANIFSRGNNGLGGAPPGMTPPGANGGMMGGGGGGAAPMDAPRPVQVAAQDFQQFEQLLMSVQAAWTARDIAALRGLATPEMAGYFGEQFAAQATRGVTNSVSNVKLESGDLAEAWAEAGREFATVAMRFSMIDVTKDGLGRVVEGNPNERVTATEVWTFVRTQGGPWLLSAIQQTR